MNKSNKLFKLAIIGGGAAGLYLANKLREKDLAFIVKSIKINYLKAAELGNQIVVQSNVEKKSDARMIFYQKVIDKISGDEFVNGEVEVCFINLSSKKPKKFPDDLLLIFD